MFFKGTVLSVAHMVANAMEMLYSSGSVLELE